MFKNFQSPTTYIALFLIKNRIKNSETFFLINIWDEEVTIISKIQLDTAPYFKQTVYELRAW